MARPKTKKQTVKKVAKTITTSALQALPPAMLIKALKAIGKKLPKKKTPEQKKQTKKGLGPSGQLKPGSKKPRLMVPGGPFRPENKKDPVPGGPYRPKKGPTYMKPLSGKKKK